MTTQQEIERKHLPKLELTRACWPVFEFIIDFDRLVQQGNLPDPSEYIYTAKAALDKAQSLAFADPLNQRAWSERIHAMLVYLIDYRILNSEWDEGRAYWHDHRLETDPDILGHNEALGGERFFEDCDQLQADFQTARRNDRTDVEHISEQLGLYMVCIRLGFRGLYHNDRQRLNDYSRKLWALLPSYQRTTDRTMFPDAYEHTLELKFNRDMGMQLSVVMTIAALVLLGSFYAVRLGWENAAGEFDKILQAVQYATFF